MENKLEKIGQNSFMDNFVKTDDILNDMCGIIESSQKAAYQAVNIALVQRNWLLGYRIAEEELGGQERSEYGLQVAKKLSKELTNRYGKGYDKGMPLWAEIGRKQLEIRALKTSCKVVRVSLLLFGYSYIM